MERVLKLLGYSMPNQMEQEIRLVRQVYAGNFEPLINFCNGYDAFQDMPRTFVFAVGLLVSKQ